MGSNDDDWGSASNQKQDDGWGSTNAKKQDDDGWGESSGTKKQNDDGWGSGGANNQDDGWGSGGASNQDDGWGGGLAKTQDDGWGGGSSADAVQDRDGGRDRGRGRGRGRGGRGGGRGGFDRGSDRGGFNRGGDRDGFNRGADRGGFNRRERDNDGDEDRGDNKRLKTDDQGERPAPYRPEELNLEEETELQGNGAGENFKKYSEQTVACFPKDIVKPVEKFEDIVSSDLLLDNIKSQRYTEMTPVQKWAMPAIRDGHDLISCAQTGSGKTAAFLVPVLQTLLKTDLEPHDPNSDRQDPYCLIISPTRELANQIYVHANMLSKDSKIKCQVIYGQISTAHLKSKLSTGCHILVATPGRLKDFVERGWIGFKNIKYIILDEGDRLVDEGFTTDIRGFFNHETMPPKESRQTLFFSATFKKETQMNAREYLKDNFTFLTVGRIGAANEDIKQEFIKVSRQEKKRELKNILSSLDENEKTIIFTQTKVAADMLAGFFNALNLSSTSIHGDRHQSQRELAIKSFRRGEKRFLISSPVGNRGLDLPKVALVINYDLPSSIDEYVHRIGRTGRAGHTGRAISFYDAERDAEILPDLIEILKEAKQQIPDWMEGGGGSVQASSGAQAGDDDDWDSEVAPAKSNQATTATASFGDDWDDPPSSAPPSKPAPVPNASNEDDWDDPKQSTSAEVVTKPKDDDEW